MDAAAVIALIALAGSIFSTLATVFGTPVLQARREGPSRTRVELLICRTFPVYGP
jgi:hypothetical protein